MKIVLNEYANLAIKKGVNLQKGQKLFISSPIHAIELVRIITKVAFENGATDVVHSWLDDELTLLKYKNVTTEEMSIFPEWKTKQMDDLADEGAAFLHVISPDPELLKDIDPAKIAAANKANSLGLKAFREKTMKPDNQWSIIAVPNKVWAEKVYPNISSEKAIKLLWESILKCSRVGDDKAVENWNKHNAKLSEKTVILNNKKFAKLHYKSAKTDLIVEMSPKQVWKGGATNTTKGLPFNPNIPTEEVFSLPKRNGVDGVLASTMPLNYGGNIIDNFTLTFKDGRVVDFTAEKGYEILENLLNTDEGARYLGEIALVPVDSPISNLSTTFYNTLFDENASCHFAFGVAYKGCIEGGESMTEEELAENGVNRSLVHVDFMVGSSDLNIDGIDEDENRTPIFIDGNWAI